MQSPYTWSDRTSAAEEAARQAYFQSHGWTVKVRRGHADITVGPSEARGHFRGKVESVVVTVYDNLLYIAMPLFIHMRCEHMGIKVPTDIAGIVSAIVDHMVATEEFAAELRLKFGARAVSYAHWYLSETFEERKTYPVLVTRSVCDNVVRGNRYVDGFERFEFK